MGDSDEVEEDSDCDSNDEEEDYGCEFGLTKDVKSILRQNKVDCLEEEDLELCYKLLHAWVLSEEGEFTMAPSYDLYYVTKVAINTYICDRQVD